MAVVESLWRVVVADDEDLMCRVPFDWVTEHVPGAGWGG